MPFSIMSSNLHRILFHIESFNMMWIQIALLRKPGRRYLDSKHKIKFQFKSLSSISKLRLQITTCSRQVFITNDVKIIGNHIILGNPTKDSEMNTTCDQSCILQCKECIQSWLYQNQLNCFKPYIDLRNTRYMLQFYI